MDGKLLREVEDIITRASDIVIGPLGVQAAARAILILIEKKRKEEK